jgi:SAM-dependent methyltransferase
MSTSATASHTTHPSSDLKNRLKTTWMAGDYNLFSQCLEEGAKEFFDRLEVAPGTRLLDVGCGAGQLALIAARSGAVVTGCDIATNWLDKARARAAAEGLQVTFEEGDAECLPYNDGEFDVVTSLIGAMFAPQPTLVAAELTRVCRPGGIIAMANWTAEGFVGQMFAAISKHIAPPGMPGPVLWRDPGAVRERLHDGISDLRLARRHYPFYYPFPPEEVVEFFRNNYGPMSRAFASLDAAGQTNLRNEIVALWSSHNKAGDGTTKVDAEYLEIIATRSASSNWPKNPGLRKVESTSRRAALLADRIEQGAAALAGFAAGVSVTAWRKPVSASDKRSIGTIVHHVASVYPIEVHVARIIADGKPVEDVTWDVVAELNAKHAAEHSEVSKSEALDLLWRNSREAAAAVRGFTDEQLDRSAPFSLSFGAPVTAQFVIEDHALRHSWHHLARIRTAVHELRPSGACPE